VSEHLQIMIGTIAHGTITVPTVHALVGLTQDFQANDLPFAFRTVERADVVVARNHLLSAFLTAEDFSHLLWIDSDMWFEPSAVWRLIALGEDFAAAAYAQKFFNWDALRARIAADPQGDIAIDRHMAATFTYNHQLGGFDGSQWTPRRRDGFITIPATGPGLSLVSRNVVETMVARGVARAHPKMAELPGTSGLRYHDFCSHLASPDGGLFLAEDQSFCYRWVEGCGGDIWLDCQSAVRHIGPIAFDGHYAERVGDDFPD